MTTFQEEIEKCPMLLSLHIFRIWGAQITFSPSVSIVLSYHQQTIYHSVLHLDMSFFVKIFKAFRAVWCIKN